MHAWALGTFMVSVGVFAVQLYGNSSINEALNDPDAALAVRHRHWGNGDRDHLLHGETIRHVYESLGFGCLRTSVDHIGPATQATGRFSCHLIQTSALRTFPG